MNVKGMKLMLKNKLASNPYKAAFEDSESLLKGTVKTLQTYAAVLDKELEEVEAVTPVNGLCNVWEAKKEMEDLARFCKFMVKRWKMVPDRGADDMRYMRTFKKIVCALQDRDIEIEAGDIGQIRCRLYFIATCDDSAIQ